MNFALLELTHVFFFFKKSRESTHVFCAQFLNSKLLDFKLGVTFWLERFNFLKIMDESLPSIQQKLQPIIT